MLTLLTPRPYLAIESSGMKLKNVILLLMYPVWSEVIISRGCTSSPINLRKYGSISKLGEGGLQGWIPTIRHALALHSKTVTRMTGGQNMWKTNSLLEFVVFSEGPIFCSTPGYYTHFFCSTCGILLMKPYSLHLSILWFLKAPYWEKGGR